MKVTRREFLKYAAVAGGGLVAVSALGGPKAALAAEDFQGRPDRLGMLTDLSLCIGCRRCEAACNQANDLPRPAVPFDDKSVLDRERRPTAEAYTVVNRYYDPHWLRGPVYRKIQCNHCDEPACVSACLVGAMKKSPEGPVIYDANRCIGCRYCMTACPFYIPSYEYDNAYHPRVQKCFMCYQRIIKNEAPACAAECPVEAITFGKRSQLLELARDRIKNNPHKYVNHIYGEYEAGGTGWLYVSGVPFEELGFPTGLGGTPYPALTREFLSAVPLVLTIWPALLGGFYLFSKHRAQTAGVEGKNPGKGDA